MVVEGNCSVYRDSLWLQEYVVQDPDILAAVLDVCVTGGIIIISIIISIIIISIIIITISPLSSVL